MVDHNESELGGPVLSSEVARNCPSPPWENPSTGVSRSDGSRLSLTFEIVLVCGVLFLAYKVVQPYLHTIILGVLLSTVWYPVHSRILRLVRGRKTLASLCSCGLMVLVVILPVSVMTVALVRQGVRSFKAVQAWIQAGGLDQIVQSSYVKSALEMAETHLGLSPSDLPDVGSTLVGFSSKIGQFLISHGGAFLGDLSSLAFKFALMIFLMFYLLLEGEGMKEWVLRMLPLKRSSEEQLIEKIRAVSRSALVGSIGTAAAQALVGAIGLAIVGIAPLFWGVMMGFASLVPMVGTAIVWVPACLYLLVTGSTIKAIVLAVWCVVLVGSIDNFLRPILMRGESGMSTLLLFFAIIGGIGYFGLIGIIYGPLIFGLCAVLLYLYQIEFSDTLAELERS